MSLNRYENEEIIVQLSQPQYGQLFLQEDLDILPHSYLTPDDPNFVKSNITQVHIYSFYGNYIAGDHDASYLIHDPYSNSLLIDLADTFRTAEIRRGSYIIAVNSFKQIWGNPQESVVYVREISPDRTEVKLSVPNSLIGDITAFRSQVDELKMANIFNNMVIDFGFNRVSKISLIRFDSRDPSIIYLKLYKPLNDEVGEKNTGWFGFETMNPYVDTIILTTPLVSGQTNQLRGANYDIDTDEWSSNSTILKSWNDLLDSDAPTSQGIIDLSLSGSASARLNIDYTDFNNYIFYSSAEERVKNFKYKLGLIETYQGSIDTLQASTASNTAFISGSVVTYQSRINTITSNLDSFERWMYYSDTSSIFTHDITGSVTPYPKYLSGGKYILHHSTSSIATTWYNGLIASASSYDQQNHSRLWWSIPEHILMDDGNSDYILFVEMVGQHFDNLYAYVRALTQIHERDEHPERGVSNDLLYHVAKSFGWKLQNTRQLSDLWFYKSGVNQTGQYASTGSMFSLSHENQTQQIWRRIVNNLPYLLKTKGTTRSIKAMMSIYGIPQTLISIKEYGGPSQENDKPQLVEDRFAYALNLDGNQYVSMDRRLFSSASDGYIWNNTEGDTQPLTYSFRFSTTYSSSVSMSMWSTQLPDATIMQDIRIHHASEITGTGSYSGSYAYGRLSYHVSDAAAPNSHTASTDYLPLFDGDMWTVRLWASNPAPKYGDASPGGTFNLEVARAADCTNGTVFHRASASVSIAGVSATGSFGVGGYTSASWGKVILGGDTSSYQGGDSPGNVSRFSGSMQGYKEYFYRLSTETFNEHVLNPGAYHVNEPTASFDALYRYFPLGLDTIRYDHTVTASVSSSHPNQDFDRSTVATFHNFTGGQSDQYRHFRETYYIYTPSIGGNNVRNNKVRIEGSNLTRDLSPTGRSEKSNYDLAPVDTNRLAIVYSLADHVNRDIYNQFGFDELDDWIADPDLECATEYAELKRYSDEYFKKYEQRNDINAFIRILSVYDYSFFEQIRQLVPGRADLIAGILIEPNILERSKICITKRPVVTNPQWEKTIKITEKDPIGEYILHETTASLRPDFEVSRETYVTASIEPIDEFTMTHCYYTASIPDPVEFSGSSIHHIDIIHQRTGICGVVDVYRNRYSGSGAPTQSVVDVPRPNCVYKKKVCYFSEWTGHTNLVTEGQFTFGTGSIWYVGGDATQSRAVITDYSQSTVAHLNTTPYKRFVTIDGNTSLSQSFSNVSGTSYCMIIRAAVDYRETVTSPLTVSMSNASFQINKAKLTTYNAEGYNRLTVGADLLVGSSSAYYVRNTELTFTGSTLDTLTLYSNNPDYPIHVYSVEIYPKYSTYTRKWIRAQNRWVGRAAYCVLVETGYQIDECGTRNLSRFEGSKMSGADFNVDSPDTVDGGPVVTIIESNPNNLFIQGDGDDGNLLVE